MKPKYFLSFPKCQLCVVHFKISVWHPYGESWMGKDKVFCLFIYFFIFIFRTESVEKEQGWQWCDVMATWVVWVGDCVFCQCDKILNKRLKGRTYFCWQFHRFWSWWGRALLLLDLCQSRKMVEGRGAAAHPWWPETIQGEWKSKRATERNPRPGKVPRASPSKLLLQVDQFFETSHHSQWCHPIMNILVRCPTDSFEPFITHLSEWSNDWDQASRRKSFGWTYIAML